MMKTTARLFPILFLLPLALLACGPKTASPSPQPQTGEVTGGIPYVGDMPASGASASTSPSASTTEVDAMGIPVGYTEDGRPYRGNLDAKVMMETFSDFQCPYCARFSTQTLPGLLENQIAGGEVVMVFYDFPLNAIHPQAAAAANAARCAGEAGAAA